MAKQMLSLRIDVSKIDKTKLYVGAKGTYLDCVVFINEETDQYGNNGMVTQSITKEEREKGLKGAILGNTKPLGQQQAPQPQQTQQNVSSSALLNDTSTDLPF